MTKNNEKKNFNEKTRDEENIENNLDKASNKASSFVENYNKINDNLSSKNEQDPNEDDKQILEEISSVMKEGIYINPIETSDDHIEGIENKIYKKEKKKKKKKNYEKTTFAHKMGVLGVLLVLGIFTGSGLGVWYFNVNLRSNVDYGSILISDYQANIDDVLAKQNVPLSDKKNWTNYMLDKTPNDLSPIDNYLLAEYNATLANSFLFTGRGQAVAMGVKQTVYSLRRYNGDYYSFESISKGTLTVANLDVYRPKENLHKVDIYTGRNATVDNADWYYNSSITDDEYYDMTGGMPNGVTAYIISEKTVKTSDFVYNNELETYTITFELDPTYGALLYYKEVRRTGGLEADPEFYSIKFIATIDKDWNLISTEVFESYKAVKFGMGITTNGTIKIDYQFNLPDVKMPELN